VTFLSTRVSPHRESSLSLAFAETNFASEIILDQVHPCILMPRVVTRARSLNWFRACAEYLVSPTTGTYLACERKVRACGAPSFRDLASVSWLINARSAESRQPARLTRESSPYPRPLPLPSVDFHPHWRACRLTRSPNGESAFLLPPPVRCREKLNRAERHWWIEISLPCSHPSPLAREEETTRGTRRYINRVLFRIGRSLFRLSLVV